MPSICRDKKTDPPATGFRTITGQHVPHTVSRRPHMYPTPHRVAFAARNILTTTITI